MLSDHMGTKGTWGPKAPGRLVAPNHTCPTHTLGRPAETRRGEHGRVFSNSEAAIPSQDLPFTPSDFPKEKACIWSHSASSHLLISLLRKGELVRLRAFLGKGIC